VRGVNRNGFESERFASSLWLLICNRLAAIIEEGIKIREDLESLLHKPPPPLESVAFLPVDNLDIKQLEDFGHTVSIERQMGNADAFSVHEIALNSLKGLCAYAAHCDALGKMDDSINTFIQEALVKLSSTEPDMDGLFQLVMDIGEANVTVMQMLDQGHYDQLGEPTPTPVRKTAVEGKCILVSGHDMADLHELLKQTEGKGINVYTHGEMLPAHSYPKLKEFPHLVGNYGTAWQNQKFEFAAFPGPILVTTNYIQTPRRNYKDRVYTTDQGAVDSVELFIMYKTMTLVPSLSMHWNSKDSHVQLSP